MKKKTVLIMLLAAAALAVIYFFIRKKAQAGTAASVGTQILPVAGGSGLYAVVPKTISDAAKATDPATVSGLNKLLLSALANSNGAPVPIATV